VPRKIRPCWLSHAVHILKKLQIMISDIIKLSPVLVCILFQKISSRYCVFVLLISSLVML
jgi:hypothetical protein